MIKDNEYEKNANVVQKKIPKIFTKNYASYVNGVNLFKPAPIKRPKCLEDEFYFFCLTEKVFCYLKDGMDEGEDIFNERYKQVKNSLYSYVLENALLLIFTHENFISAKVKTPNLYFETYKIIIKSHNIKIDNLISIIKTAKADGSEVHNEKLMKLVHSKNLDEKDLVYIYFSSQPSNLSQSMHLFIDKCNSISKYLFHSDLNSHLVDDLLKLRNKDSFYFIQRVLKGQVVSGIRYTSNWKFENNVPAIVWFNAYRHYKEIKIDIAKAIEKYRYVERIFLSCNIYQPKIMAMFPEGIPFVNLCKEASMTFTNEKLDDQTFFSPSKKIKAIESKIDIQDASENLKDELKPTHGA